MKIPLRFFCIAIVLLAGFDAAAGPIRVLYLGNEGTAAPTHCATFMRELGRDAIWFDYTSDAGAVTREWLAKFDAVVLDAPGEDFQR